MKKGLIQIFLIILALLLLQSCRLASPKGDINSAADTSKYIRQDIKNNSKVEKENSFNPPEEIVSNLVPDLPINSAQGYEEGEQKFDLNVDDAPAKAFFASLVKNTEKSIMVSPRVSGNVSLHLKNVTIPQALDAVRDIYGYEYTTTSYGYKVLPAELTTELFHVDYLNIIRENNNSTGITTSQSSGGGGAGTTQSSESDSDVTTTSTNDFWLSLTESLESMIGKDEGRNVVVNPSAGLVMVKAFPNEIRQVREYLDSIQTTVNRQVIIEAKIVEIDLDAKFAAGIRLDSSRFKKLLNNKLLSAAEAAQFSNLTSLTFYTKSLETVIEALSDQGRVNTLFSQRLATANDQPAVFKVGEDEFHITDVSTTSSVNNDNQNDNNNTIGQNVTLTSLFSGIALNVTPHIDRHGGMTIHIHPVITNVTDKDKEFTVNNQGQALPLANTAVRESDSIIHAESGQVIMIGGLVRNTTTKEDGNFPILSRIPIFGDLIDNRERESKRTEMIILLKPTVIDHKTNQEQLKKAAHRFDLMSGPFKYQLERKHKKPKYKPLSTTNYIK